MENLKELSIEQLVQRSQTLALDQEAIRETRRAIREEIDRKIAAEKQARLLAEHERLVAKGLVVAQQSEE